VRLTRTRDIEERLVRLTRTRDIEERLSVAVSYTASARLELR
jgi:hypothetical protein